MQQKGNQNLEESKHMKPNSLTVTSSQASVKMNEDVSPSKLLAWCSRENNKISIMDLETKTEYTTFDGAQISNTSSSWTLVKEIPNTNLLVSLHHNYEKSANLEIFDISKKGQAKKVYSLGEVKGVTGEGDVTYNIRRNILGAISLGKKLAYHLFTIPVSALNVNHSVKLNRKSSWHPQYSEKEDNVVTGLDFNPSGEVIATVDRDGVCLVADVNTNRHNLHLPMGGKPSWYNRCRWSTNSGESALFVKYDHKKLNILDVEKKTLTLTNPIPLENEGNWTLWIDVCQTNGNLLASGGEDRNVKIFDKRESKVVKSFDGIHSCLITCVRWSPNGEMVASASDDGTVRLLDFRTEKIIHTEKTSDQKKVMSVCFI